MLDSSAKVIDEQHILADLQLHMSLIKCWLFDSPTTKMLGGN